MKTIYDMSVDELRIQLRRHSNYVKEIKRLLKKRNKGYLPPTAKAANEKRSEPAN